MSITSANAILTLSIATIFPTPQQIQEFATDDIYDIPSIKSVETRMGVDGVLTAGFVFVAIPQTITLQADSPSCALFDAWHTQQEATMDVYAANGMIKLPSLATKFTQTRGFLTGYKPAPAGKRVLEPRQFEITWESIAPAPA